MSGDTKRVLEVNQIDNLQGSTQRVKQETTLNNMRGVTQRVYVVGGGSAPVIDELNVTPSTSAQTITAPSGVDGYSPVNISAVDSTIDANIVAGNIKKDIQILGVTGSYEGQTPTGSISITNNGTYDVTDKATAVVNVPTTAPAYYIEKTVDANGKLIGGSTVMNFNGVTDIGEDYGLAYAFQNCPNITGVIDMSDLIAVSPLYALSKAFAYDTGITSVNLSSLTTISGSFACSNTFDNCQNMTSFDLSALTTISGMYACSSMFSACRSLTSASFPALTTLTGNNCCSSMFINCKSLTSVSLSVLTTLTGSNVFQHMFNGCTSLTSLSFPALTSTSFGTQTNQFANMLMSVTGCTVHFPSNLQSVIGSWADVVAGFGGTNTTVLFDLPATES